MKDDLERLFAAAQKFELESQGMLSTVTGRIATTSVADQVDCGFMCREIAKIMETLRKAFTMRQEMLSRSLAMMASVEAMRGVDLRLEGSMATATIDVTSKPCMPNPGTPEYLALMRYLGVPDAVIEAGTVRPSFRALEAELTRRMSSGEQLPPGVSKSFPDMLATYRTKNRKTKVDQQLEKSDVEEE